LYVFPLADDEDDDVAADCALLLLELDPPELHAASASATAANPAAGTMLRENDRLKDGDMTHLFAIEFE